MDLYIDCENLKSLILSKKNDDYDDCLRMIRRQLHIVYNVNKSTFKNDPELAQWLLRMGEGRGDSEETDSFYNVMFPSRPIKSNSYINWNRKELSSIFLIDDVDLIKLKNKGCVLVGDIGEELLVLLKLFCGKDYDYHHSYVFHSNFKSWNQLVDDNQILPCTDIIINDRYLFNNNYDLVNYNLSLMLEAFTHNVKSKLNITIFTYKDHLFKFDPSKAFAIIKKTVEKNTGIKPNITFVVSGDSDKIPHDRFVITNYRLIRSGDSFLYFNMAGDIITNGSSFDIYSLAKREYSQMAEDLLIKLQNTCNDIAKLNKDMIIGNKISSFLTFN